MYNTSQHYKNKILKDSTIQELNIYIDGKKIEDNHIISFNRKINLFNNNEFCLGCTPEIDIELEIDRIELPEHYNEIYVESGLGDEIIPIGKFAIKKPIVDDELKVKIIATDYMTKFESNYDGSNLNYPATLMETLQDICRQKGVELGSTSFLNMNKQIAVYDNTIPARTYVSYIAEQAGGFAHIGRDGKLYIKSIGQDVIEFDINLFADYKWGDKFKISRVSYEDGIQNYKFGDETNDTVYISSNNMYIVDSEQIENIYNNIKDFEIYSFEGTTIIDPAYDIGDILIIDGKPILYQGEIEYSSKFKASIQSKIQPKTENESCQTKTNTATKIRRVESKIDQIDGQIEQLVQETGEHEDQISQVLQDVDGISQKVGNIVDTTRIASGVKEIKLEKCIKGYLLNLHIYGNNSVFKYLYPANDLYPANNLYPHGDSRIIVTDENGNSKMYELRVTDVLRVNDEVRDEYILENNVARVIRRVNEDGTTKEIPEEEIIGKYTIYIEQGDNTITIQNYSARIEARYVQQNSYTDQFATKVEMNSSINQSAEQIQSKVNRTLKDDYSTTQEIESKITQTAEDITSSVSKNYTTKTELKQTTDNISSTVSKKVGENEIISKINQSAETVGINANKIELSANDVLNLLAGNTINLTSKNIVISSDSFQVNKNGKLTCSDVTITGGKIDMTRIGTVVPIVKVTNGSQYSFMQAGSLQISDGASETLVLSSGIETPSLTQTSLASEKKNFEKLENALQEILKTDIYKYHLKAQKDADKKHIGFVIGDEFKHSREITSEDAKGNETGVDLYSMVSVLWKAVQEQQELIEQIQKKLERKELENAKN